MRVSRDKRGYEQISLVHVFGGRRGKPSKPRLLYVFRTPPGVKVGREPFDESVRRELEAQNPSVVFDWKRLSNIPEPAPDVEYWKEKRRAEKAAKLARREEELADAAAGQSGIEALGEHAEPEEQPGGADGPAPVEPESSDELAGAIEVAEAFPSPGSSENGLPVAPRVLPDPIEGRSGDRLAAGRRRRRRGGRGRYRRPGPLASLGPVASGLPEPSAQAPEAGEKSNPPKTTEDPSKEG